MFTTKTQAAEAEKAAIERAKQEKEQAIAAQKANAKLEKLAEKLRKDIEDKVRKNSSDKYVRYETGIPIYDVDQSMLESLEGFKHLSAICADPAVDVAVEIYGYDSITRRCYEIYFNLEKPYDGPLKQTAPPAQKQAEPAAAVVTSDPFVDNAVLAMPKDQLQALLARIRKERPDDFSTVANADRNYAVTTRSIKAPRPIKISKP
jgi:hypothetical protein